MSTETSQRKRKPRINYMDAEKAPRKKIKVEVETPAEDMPEPVQLKQPFIVPEEKMFYPCHYCSEIFPQENTSITHMKKCSNKNGNMPVETKWFIKSESSMSNSEEHQSMVENFEDINSSGSSTGNNKPPKKEIRINRNITAKEPFSEEQLLTVSSVCNDNKRSSDEDSVENATDGVNKLCQKCNTLFDSPIEHLRHIRDCQDFPKIMLPLGEIEKYFDSPNRDHCPICKKPLKTSNMRTLFIRHLLVHTSGMKHECGVCKKKFKRRDHMRIHEKRHVVAL